MAACRNGERDAVVQSMRTHRRHAHTHALSLRSPLSLARSLALSLSLVPSRQQPARCEKWIRWARGDGATPPLSSFFPPARLAAASQGPPLIIQTREWCNAHHIGRISPCNPQPPPARLTHMYIHTERGPERVYANTTLTTL